MTHLLSHSTRIADSTWGALRPVSTWSSGGPSGAGGTGRALGEGKSLSTEKMQTFARKEPSCHCQASVSPSHSPSDPRRPSRPSLLGVPAGPEGGDVSESQPVSTALSNQYTHNSHCPPTRGQASKRPWHGMCTATCEDVPKILSISPRKS